MQRSTRRDHTLREILSASIGDLPLLDVDTIVETVLRTLDQQRMISYAPAGDLPLLTTHGRALVAIMEDPGITMRALAVYLGVSESNAQKSVKALLDKGIIAKTKVNNSLTYKIEPNPGLIHPDISRLFDAIVKTVLEGDARQVDIQSPAKLQKSSEMADPPF